MSAANNTSIARNAPRPRTGIGRAAIAHSASAALSTSTAIIIRLWDASSTVLTEGASITPGAAYSPVATAAAAPSAPRASIHRPLHCHDSRRARNPIQYISAAANSSAIGKWTISGWMFCRCCAPVNENRSATARSRSANTALFHRIDGQKFDSAFGVRLARNRDFLLHVLHHVVGQRLVVLGRQQDVHLLGPLFDQADRDALLGALERALRVASPVSANRVVAEGVLQTARDRLLRVG